MAPIRIYLDTNHVTNCVEARVPAWALAGIEALRGVMFEKLKTDEAEGKRGSRAYSRNRRTGSYQEPIVRLSPS
jgi:hypothetical protein